MASNTNGTTAKGSESSSTGAIERALIGAAIGAFVGTIFLPGVGTAGGAKIGAMIGGGSSDLS